MKKNGIVFSAIIAVLVIIGVILYLVFNSSDDEYEVFNPDSGHCDLYKGFVDNQVILYFYDNTSFEQIKDFVISIDATLDASKQNSINFYAVTLNKTFASSEEVLKYCDKLLNEHKIIEDCFINICHPITDAEF